MMRNPQSGHTPAQRQHTLRRVVLTGVATTKGARMNRFSSLRRHLTAALAALVLLGSAAAQTELRFTWYDDGNEGQVLRDLLDRFEADNPDIRVIIDTVPYDSGILQSLPLQLATDAGPDIARVTDLGGLAEYFLDLRPYVEDPAYWEENFGPLLVWMRVSNSAAYRRLLSPQTIPSPRNYMLF